MSKNTQNLLWVAEARFKAPIEHPKYPDKHLDKIHVHKGRALATDGITVRVGGGLDPELSTSLTAEQFAQWLIAGILPNPLPPFVGNQCYHMFEERMTYPHPHYPISIKGPGLIQVKAVKP